MKKYIVLVIAFLTFTLNAQEYNKVEEYKPGKKMLLGKINLDGFKSKDFDWWQKNYDEYQPNDHVIQNLKDSINDYSIKIFFGSWCGDSKRYVPRFYNVIEKAGYNTDKVELIALDKRQGAYKQSPTHEEKGLYIHRVPTFIFYKDGKEVGRIVERPHSTIENDIKYLLENKEKASPYYGVAEYIISLIKAKETSDLYEDIDSLANYLSDYVKGSKELNTLGNVFLDAKEYDNAEYVFNLNTKIFPYKAYTYASIASLHNEKKEYSEALKYYYKALSLYPGDHYDDTINEIKEKIKKEKEKEEKEKDEKSKK